MSTMPERGYAHAPDGTQIAYAVAGTGPVSILGLMAVVPVELMWDEPRSVRFLDGLSSFSRHAWFDPRGHGSSGPLPPGEGRLVEGITDDMVSVLNSLGERRVVALTFAAPSPALLFAATYPSRVQALVLVEPSARLRSDGDYGGYGDDEVDAALVMIEHGWGSGVVYRRMEGLHTADVDLERWRAKCERLWGTPTEAKAIFHSAFDADLRGVLPAISVPTLVVARRASFRVRQSRYVAEHINGARYLEVPDDHFLQQVLDATEEFVTGRLPEHATNRVLATVLFTDIVASTVQAATLGDREWRRRLDAHDAMVRNHLARFRGREVKTTGDGFLATFDGPARAVRCGCAIRDETTQMGMAVRVGLHTGEIELRGDDIGGIAVHIAARVAALGEPSEVLVSDAIPRLVVGSEIKFDDRGEHELKGVPGTWSLYAVEG